MDNNEITEALRECKQLARECLDKGLLREAIATMFLVLLLTGMSMDDYEQLRDRAFDGMGNDPEKVRQFIESWEIGDCH